MAYKNDEPNGSKSFSYRWDDKLMFGKMRTFHICSLFVVFSLGHYVRGEPEELKKYDDTNFQYDENDFKRVYEIAKEYGNAHKHGNYVEPYRSSDYAKLGYDIIPNRYKEKLIYYFIKFTTENGMDVGEAAFEAVRYSTEDMMDIYQGRLHSSKDMARLREIRNTDPMRFMVYAAVNDYTWFKNAKKGNKPTFKDFREFTRAYYQNNPPKVRPAE